MLCCDQILDRDLLNEIKAKNYSRIPIYYQENNNKIIFGILFMKSLVGIDL